MSPSDIQRVARSIISAWLIDHVRARALLLQRALLVISCLCLVLAFATGGGWRLAFGAVGTGCALLGLGGMVVRALAIAGIRKLAAPKHFDAYHDEVQSVLEAADLPTTPLSALRMVNRLRRGVGDEANRLYELGRQVANVIVSTDSDPPDPTTP